MVEEHTSVSKKIVFTAVIAALYTSAVLFFAPISYGGIQFRVANLLKPIMLFNPLVIFGFALGDFFANMASPFGVWDFVAMPVVEVIAGFALWFLRRIPPVALLVNSLLISLGVCIFPLYLGGGIPIQFTFPGVFLSQIVLLFGGYYLIWRNLSNLFTGV